MVSDIVRLTQKINELSNHMEWQGMPIIEAVREEALAQTDPSDDAVDFTSTALDMGVREDIADLIGQVLTLRQLNRPSAFRILTRLGAI